MSKTVPLGGVILGALPPERDLTNEAKDTLRGWLSAETRVRRSYLTWVTCRDGEETPHELVRDIVRNPQTGKMDFHIVKYTGASGFQMGVELEEGTDANGWEVQSLAQRLVKKAEQWIPHGVIIVNNLEFFGAGTHDAYVAVSECIYDRDSTSRGAKT
jgi:hypothetical protein